MRRQRGDILKGAGWGAIVALFLSLLAIALPSELGGYNEWADWHLAIHNIAAIMTRLVVFAATGAAVGGLCGRIWRRRNR